MENRVWRHSLGLGCMNEADIGSTWSSLSMFDEVAILVVGESKVDNCWKVESGVGNY